MINKKQYFLLVLISVFLTYPAINFAATDDVGDYYTSNKGVDGDITKYEITIERLTLKNSSTGAEVVLMDTSVTKDITQASSQQISEYFKQKTSIPLGIYDQIGVQFGNTSVARGCVQNAGGKFYATGQDDTAYDTLAEALSAATDMTTIYDETSVLEYVPENPTGTITISKDNIYTLKVLWSVAGLETDNDDGLDKGVGLVWETAVDEMMIGMMQEQYIMVDQDENEQYFTGD